MDRDTKTTDESVSAPECRVPTIIQQPLWEEAKNAVKMSLQYKIFDNFKENLYNSLHYNSSQTRKIYNTNIIGWFFPEKRLDTLLNNVWRIYHDEKLLQEIMRYQYLSVEEGVAKFVTDTILALDPGDEITSVQIKNFVNRMWNINERYAAKIVNRIRAALLCTGFATKRKELIIQKIEPPKTALIILTHYLFAQSPKTVAIRDILDNPYWKYLGIRSEEVVRDILKEANSKGILSKYIVADELEQITTRYSLDELLERKIKI
ncbi:MAG TPA: hypothetical protein HA221_04000 [Halobacteria archaeon]|nr:hypothetical protein [Halobacteria archaeon]